MKACGRLIDLSGSEDGPQAGISARPESSETIPGGDEDSRTSQSKGTARFLVICGATSFGGYRR